MSPPAPPPVWMIGDVQGCADALQRLLAQPEIAADLADPRARLWFAGDLVNRGPASAAVLRHLMALGERAVCVLGNHDLHLLACAAGVRPAGRRDTLAEILHAPDAKALIDWLRARPLAHHAYGHVMVHAGIPAPWSAAQTRELAAEVEAILRSADWQVHLAAMYGDKPNRWKESLRGDKRLRFIINALTRMRLCTPDGRLALADKSAPDAASAGLLPWFDVPGRVIAQAADTTVVFGHWSTLGLLLRPDVICLDSGCVWGGKLTAVRLHDRRVVQVACAPGGSR